MANVDDREKKNDTDKSDNIFLSVTFKAKISNSGCAGLDILFSLLPLMFQNSISNFIALLLLISLVSFSKG